MLSSIALSLVFSQTISLLIAWFRYEGGVSTLPDAGLDESGVEVYEIVRKEDGVSLAQYEPNSGGERNIKLQLWSCEDLTRKLRMAQCEPKVRW